MGGIMNTRMNIRILWLALIVILLTHCEKATSAAKNDVTNPKHIAVSEILPNEKTGYIEGTTCYPADGMPSDMRIYAENTENNKIYMVQLSSINDANIFIDTMKYKMRLPEGSFYVYAKTNRKGSKQNYNAYYSDYVKCGLHVKCTSHEPIIIKIRANETISNVDPCDWYDTYNEYRHR
jgi:hypothetical protein